MGTIIPSYTQEVFLRFSLDECSIKFDSMTDRGLFWDLSDNNQSLKLQLFMGRLFDACKKEKAEYTDESEDDSDEETEFFSIYVSNYFIFLSETEIYFSKTMFTTPMGYILIKHIYRTNSTRRQFYHLYQKKVQK